MLMRKVLLLGALAALALPASASAADLPATPSNFQTVYNGASGGDNVILAAGSYGSFQGGTKSSTVTLKPAPGASVSMAGADFNGASNTNITGVRFTDTSCVMGSSQNIDFDTDVFDNLGTGCNEGRLGYVNGSTGTVRNSHFGGGGCSDGVMISGGGGPWPTVNLIGNEFVDLRQGTCGPHVDAVSYYGGYSPRVEDNYVHSVSTGIEGYDSNGQVDTVKNNVLVGDESAAVLLASSNVNGVFTHNVVIGRQLRLDGGHDNVPPTGNTIKDNVADDIEVIGGSGNTITNNLTSAQVTFTGGTGRCGYATSSPTGTATDGTNIGLNDCGGAPPPQPECSDGINNDPTEDMLIDYPADPGCSSATDTTELGNPPPPPNPQCSDGVDNDSDGYIDYPADPDCTSATDDNESDTTAPETTMISTPPSSTTSTTATFDYGASEAGYFECRLDGGAWVTGCWPPKTYTGLAVGTHTFDVRTQDIAGNYDPTPATYTWTITGSGGSVTAPTFVAEAEVSSWATTTSPKSVSLPVQAGDVLVAYSMSEGQQTLTIGGNQTWTSRQYVNASNFGSARAWTATVASTGTATVTFSRNNPSAQFGGDVLQFRGSSGIGASGQAHAVGLPTLTFTTLASDSAIVKVNNDWASVDGYNRNSLTATVGAFTEKTYARTQGHYTVYGGYHANAGAAGAKTIGYDAPANQTYSLIGVEVKGA